MAEFLEGVDAKADISRDGVSWLPYSFKRFRITYENPEQDVSNSEGRAADPGYDVELPGVASTLGNIESVRAEFEEATFDFINNLFDAPIAIGERTWIYIKAYPLGRAEDYHYLHLQVSEIMHGAEIPGLQPFSFRGKTDGDFRLYGTPKG